PRRSRSRSASTSSATATSRTRAPPTSSRPGRSFCSAISASKVGVSRARNGLPVARDGRYSRMDAASLVRLLLLAAIWGSSFLFMRVAAPILGPTVLIAWRVALAAIFLLAIAALSKRAIRVRTHWRHYLILGACNSAVPFLLFAFAAQTLSASLLSILNATAPIFAAAIAGIAGRTLPSPKVALGLILGVVGVTVLASFDAVMLRSGAVAALLAALGASLSYGIASSYAKSAPGVDPFANALGTMC